MKKTIFAITFLFFTIALFSQDLGKTSLVGREISWDWKKSKVKGVTVSGESYYIFTSQDSVYILNYDSYGELSHLYWMALKDLFIPTFAEPIPLGRGSVRDFTVQFRGKGFQIAYSEYGKNEKQLNDNLFVEIVCDNDELHKRAKTIVTSAFSEKLFDKLLDYEMGTIANEDKALYNKYKNIQNDALASEKQTIANNVTTKEVNKGKVGNYKGDEEYRYVFIFKGEGSNKLLQYDRKTGEVLRSRNYDDLKLEAYLRPTFSGSTRFFKMLSSDNATPKYNASQNGFSCLWLGATSGQLSNAKFKTSDFIAETYSFTIDNLKDKKKYYIDRVKETIKDEKGEVLYTTNGQLNGVELILLLALLEDI